MEDEQGNQSREIVEDQRGAIWNRHGDADADGVKNKIELDDFDTMALRLSLGRSF